MKKELLKGLTEEQIAKVKDCKNQEELLKIAKEEGVELSDEQLNAVSGGGCFSTFKCPNCGSKDYEQVGRSRDNVDEHGFVKNIITYKCNKCGKKWDD